MRGQASPGAQHWLCRGTGKGAAQTTALPYSTHRTLRVLCSLFIGQQGPKTLPTVPGRHRSNPAQQTWLMLGLMQHRVLAVRLQADVSLVLALPRSLRGLGACWGSWLEAAGMRGK